MLLTMKATVCSLMELLVIYSRHLHAQPVAADKEPEPVAILEQGGTGGQDLKDAASGFGPTVAVEVEPIERWLEMEPGIRLLFDPHSTESRVDLRFKRSWILSKKVEVLLGIRPESVHDRKSGTATNAIAGEAVADFMFGLRASAGSARISSRATNTSSFGSMTIRRNWAGMTGGASQSTPVA